MPKDITVLVADDHPIFRQGLAAIIDKSDKLLLAGEAENGRAAIDLIEDLDPDVVILDIDMPVMDGIEAAREIKDRSIRTMPIFLTMHKDKSILRSLKSLGVKGYILKDSVLDEIVTCIRAVVAGKTYLSPALNDLILDNVGEPGGLDSFPLIRSLTHAEKRVLCLITDSKTNREIAADLFVTTRTVETHRYNICLKLNLNGAHALFKFALQNRKKILELIGE